MAVSKSVLIRFIGIIMSLFWVLLLSFALPAEQGAQTPSTIGFSWNGFLISTSDPMYPFNLQVMMWIAFFICMSELFIKWFKLIDERAMMNDFRLYENPGFVTFQIEGRAQQINLDPSEALKPELLAAIYHAKKDILHPGALVTQMFTKINHQFHSTNDVADVYSAVTSMLELKLHEVDLRYTVVRYLAWLIPTLGFIGTVIGIAIALGTAGTLEANDPELLQKVVPLLSVAFYTTLLALILSAIVMILLQIIQAQDEETVSEVGQYCLDNIVINLKPRSN